MSNYISRAGLQAYYGTGWRRHLAKSGGSINKTYYINAPVFEIVAKAIADGGVSGSAIIVSAYRYNIANGVWEDMNTPHSITFMGQTLSANCIIMVAAISSFNYRESTDTYSHNMGSEASNNHLWKITVDSRISEALWGSAYRDFDIYAGGVWCSADSNGNTYKRGKPIRFSSCEIYESGYSSDGDFVNAQHPNNFNGVKITTNNAYGCYTEG